MVTPFRIVRRTAPVAVFLSLSTGLTLAAVLPFPGVTPGIEIGEGLQRGYEGSGALWHPRLRKLFLVHDGGSIPSAVSSMNDDGSRLTHWEVQGDLEGITVADSATDFVYIGVENPNMVFEFDVTTGEVGRRFELDPWMNGDGMNELEGLAFVTDPTHREGGLFYAGQQGRGEIYVFELPVKSSRTSTSVKFIRSFKPTEREDLADLNWDPTEKILYALYDSANTYVKMLADGTVLGEYRLPGGDQEGIAVRSCTLFVAEDTGEHVYRYDGFPDDDTDDDQDGVANCRDQCAGTARGADVDADGCSATGGGCSADDDCDDGLYCNGDEQCVSGSCQAGRVVSCGDGVACTTDRCNEATDACESIPRNSACDDGQWCNGKETCSADSGCLAGAPPQCADQLCSESKDACVDCVTSNDCSGGETCDGSTGTCVMAALADPLPIEIGDTWRYFAGRSDPPAKWKSLAFDDASWKRGPSGFGYGDDCPTLLGTRLDAMQGDYPSLYLRRTFRVDDPTMINSLTLTMDYDDGFVVYVNGTEVTRRNVAGNPPTCVQLASVNRECSLSPDRGEPAESFSIDPEVLVAGTNIIAIQGHNLSVDSTDFTLLPSLSSVVQQSCSSNADCSDGLFCNGRETCIASVCRAGSTPCGDDVACTADQCDEASNACTNTPEDALCSDGRSDNGMETCSATDGCSAGVVQNVLAGGDYDGDGWSDLAVYRAGQWSIRRSGDLGRTEETLGLAGDLPVPGDYDGDGMTDPAVFRAGRWIVLRSSTGRHHDITLGSAGDLPVPGDFDGDGKTDAAVFRGGRWIVSRSSDGTRIDEVWGQATDLTVPADYDEDGLTDLAVFRAGRWIVRQSATGQRQDISFGRPGDVPAPHDYDGDGKADHAIYRLGQWLVRRSADASRMDVACGGPGDLVVPLLYDADGKADPAVFRDGMWTIYRSKIETSKATSWGQPGDEPVSH